MTRPLFYAAIAVAIGFFYLGLFLALDAIGQLIRSL